MAGIRVYSTPEVKQAPRAAGTLRYNPQDPTRGFTAALGETAQFMQEEIHKANVARVRGDLNTLQEEKLRLLEEASQAQGEAAVKPDAKGRTLADRILSGLDAKAQALRGGLANPDQQERFEAQARSLRLELEGQVRRHVAGQAEGLARANFAGGLAIQEKEAQEGIRGGDFERAGRALSRARQIAGEEAERRGYSGETAAAHAMEALTPLHATTLKALVEGGQVELAGKYLERNAPEMTPQVVEAMQAKIKAGALDRRVESAVDGVWSAHGPKSDREPANLDQLRGKLKETLGDDPAALKLAMASLKERASERDYSIRQRESAVFGGLWKRVLAGESLKALKASPEYRDGLDGDTQAKFITEVERFRDRGGEGNNMAQFAEFWAYATNPERLAGMSDAEVFALAPRLGPALTKQLLTRKQGLGRGDAEVIEATVDADLFNHLARQNGLVVDNPSDAEKAVLGELKYRVEQTIDLEQQRLGKKLSRQEKEGIVSKLLLQVPIVSERSWMNPARWFGDKNSVEFKRLFTATAEDLQKLDASIVADEQVIYGLLNDFAEAGVLPTKERLREAYIRKMQPGKGK